MEQIRSLRWPIVALSILITLGALFAGDRALQATTQDGPAGAFLRAQPTVGSYRLDRQPEGLRVAVTLRDVPDLGQSYRAVAEGLARSLDARRLDLVVADRRTPALAEAFYRVNPLVQEALATGRYGGLLEQAEARAAGLGVDRIRIGIDSNRIYVQLHAGADYLYEVLRRPDANRPAERAGAEGGWGL